MIYRSSSNLSRALIMGLDKSTRPNAIARTIVAIVVLALYGHASRARTHVSEKSLKAFPPLVANANASSAVIGVARVLGILAALFHALPDHIKGAVVISRFAFSLGHFLGKEASTAGSVASFHRIRCDNEYLAAIAPESPHGMSIRSPFSGWFNRNKATKPSTGNVDNLLRLGFAIPEMSEAARALFRKFWLPSIPLMTTANAFGRDR